jgi:hypothetical protein
VSTVMTKSVDITVESGRVGEVLGDVMEADL